MTSAKSETIRCFIDFSVTQPALVQVRLARQSQQQSPIPQLMMMLRRSLLLHRFAAQKILFLAIFFVLMGPLRIFALHLHALFHRQLRQMPNEEHQFPTIFLRVGASAKRRHAREANSVLDSPKKFAVRKLLGFLQTKVGRLRVQTLPVQRVAAAIVAVAGGAMIRE